MMALCFSLLAWWTTSVTSFATTTTKALPTRIRPTTATRMHYDNYSLSSKSSDFDNTGAENVNVVQGITLKIAVDRSWGVADRSSEKSERFTSPSSLDMVHRLRRDSDGILIGKVTVEQDNPTLTVRRGVTLRQGQQPVRIILDSQLSLNTNQYAIFNDGLATLVYHMDTIDEERIQAYAATDQVTCVGVPLDGTNEDDEDENAGRLNVTAVVQDLLTKQGLTHVMVEGGPAVARSFLEKSLVDRAILIVANQIEFIDPYPSGMSEATLEQGGLECLGKVQSSGGGGDVFHCWSRPNLKWPTKKLEDWP